MMCPSCNKKMSKGKVDARVGKTELESFVAWICPICRAVIRVEEGKKR